MARATGTDESERHRACPHRRVAAVVAGLVVTALAAAITPASAARDIDRICPPTLPQDYAAAGESFHDVPAGHTHAVGIYCIAAVGVTTGTAPRVFSPQAPVTRAQMATFLRRLLAASERPVPDAGRDAFVDDEGSIHEANIDAMAAAGIVPSTGDRFRPNDAIRRDEMATWMNATWVWVTGSPATGSSHTFTDIGGNPHAGNIAAMHHHGVVNGRTATTYGPASAVTRGQMGSFLARLLTMHADAGHYPGTPAASLVRDRAAEDQILFQHNAARAEQGLPPLARSACLDGVASAWTQHMAAQGSSQHNPEHEQQIRACYPTTLRYWGENIANHLSVSQITSFWMGSTSHRSNILRSTFTTVGIAVWRDPSGRLWATVDFAGVA